MARTKAVVLRLSEEEYNLLKELSGREPMNAYLRRVALEVPAKPSPEPQWAKPPDIPPEMFEDSEDWQQLRKAEGFVQPTKWFCAKCNKLSGVPRCPSNPDHKVTPA